MRWLWLVAVVGALVLVAGGAVNRMQAHDQIQRFAQWEACQFNHKTNLSVCGPAPTP